MIRKKDREKQGLFVEVINNDVDKALKRLRKLSNQENLFDDIRKNEHYQKPSEKRRSARNEGRKKWRTKESKLRAAGRISVHESVNVSPKMKRRRK